MSASPADSALAALQGAIAAAVRGRFGDRLAADLDRVSLANDDEPAVVFSVCDDPTGG